MACNGCGVAAPMTKDQTENLINQMLDKGKLGKASDIRWTDNTMTWKENGEKYSYTIKLGNFGKTISLGAIEADKYDVNTEVLAGHGISGKNNKFSIDLEEIAGDYLKVENGKLTLDLDRAKPQYDGTGKTLLGYLVEV